MGIARSRPPKSRASVLAVALVVALCSLAARSPAAPPGTAPTPELRIDFLDVGHGDAILLTSPAGKTVLIDGGPAEAGETVARFVRTRTGAPLDLVVLTHRHADHLGGLAKVIERQGARLFMDAPFPHPSPAYDLLIRLLEELKIPVREAQAGRIIDIGGGARLVLLTPPQPRIVGSRSDANANSVVARLELGRVRVLLTGDAEAVTESWLLDSRADLRADVLKLAHHGSRYSSTSRFLLAVAPQVVIASSGPITAVGHIHPDTVARIEELGARLYRTDRDGNITVRTDGQRLTVETQGSRSIQAVEARR